MKHKYTRKHSAITDCTPDTVVMQSNYETTKRIQEFLVFFSSSSSSQLIFFFPIKSRKVQPELLDVICGSVHDKPSSDDASEETKKTKHIQQKKQTKKNQSNAENMYNALTQKVSCVNRHATSNKTC